MKKKNFKRLFGFTRLVKPFARFSFAFEPKAQSGSKTSQTKFRFAHSYGFTLAEVLITLSILGVVAAITVPSLTNKNTEKQTVTKVKKEYSALAEAYEQIIATDGPASKWIRAGSSASEVREAMATHFKPYLAIAKDCSYNNKECLKDAYVNNIDGTASGNHYNDSNTSYKFYKVLLKDGSTVIFTSNSDGSQPHIWVDIDGPKGKNTFGKDYFCFWLTDKGLMPRGSQQQTNFGYTDEPLNTKCKQNGYACAAWVIYKGNMDYLRKDISW